MSYKIVNLNKNDLKNNYVCGARDNFTLTQTFKMDGWSKMKRKKEFNNKCDIIGRA